MIPFGSRQPAFGRLSRLPKTGKELAEIREEIGATQQEFGDLLDLSRVTIGLLERGEKPIQTTVAMAVLLIIENPNFYRRCLQHERLMKEKFLIVEKNDRHGPLVIHETTALDKHIGAVLKNKLAVEERNLFTFKPSRIEYGLADYDDKQETVEIRIELDLYNLSTKQNSEQVVCFHIQTTNQFYKPELGCWIYTDNSGEDKDFNEVEAIAFQLFDIPLMAEAYIQEFDNYY